MGFVGIVGLALMGLGLLAGLVGGIWLLIKAFQTSVAWGCSFFIPFVGAFAQIVFIFKYWSEAQKPFLISIGGWILMMVGANLSDQSVLEFLQRQDDSAYSAEADYDYSDYDDEDDGGTLASRPSLANPPPVESAGQVADPLDDLVSDLPTDTGLPAPPPSPTAGRFQRRQKAQARRGSVSLDNVGRFIGSKVKITKTSTKTIVGYVIDVTETHVIIEERMGGGRLSYPVEKSTIRSIELASN